SMNTADELVTITPIGSFVIKTRLQVGTTTPKYRAANTKVFINVCTSPLIPLPEKSYNPPETYQLIMSNEWEIPIVASEERDSTDKKGQLSYVYDCVINDEAMSWIHRDPQLREIVMEWCMESVEVRSELTLDREQISVPKMVSKGAPQEIKLLKSELHGTAGSTLDGPDDVIQLKRLVDDDEDLDINLDINEPLPKPNRKPLIQEIKELEINDTKPEQAPKVRPEEAKKERLKYETSMSKINLANGYKLRIEIKSQNSSSLDYTLSLDRSRNAIVLQNENRNYESKDLELALPDIFQTPEIKSFFVATERKLVLFIK
ncbi:Pih1p CYBJADRAFT_122111, partial [Cyberlindnera jadinii NRRL Y-1542]